MLLIISGVGLFCCSGVLAVAVLQLFTSVSNWLVKPAKVSMARGRGTGAGSGTNSGCRRQTRANPGRQLAGAADANDSNVCSTCSGSLDIGAIGCVPSIKWFHPTTLCMGIPGGVIDTIKNFGGDGVTYVCTECRSGQSNGGATQVSAFKQLLLSVNKLCETVQQLSARVEKLSTGNSTGVADNVNSDNLRLLIGEECRELEERMKRANSVIIRGVNAQSPHALAPLFDSLCTELMGCTVPLRDVVCINASKKLFRAKIDNEASKHKLLDSAKNLKNSSTFSSVFINRDLTYKQRQVLHDRRRSRDINRNLVEPSNDAGTSNLDAHNSENF